MKWTYRIAGVIGGALCFFAGFAVGDTGHDVEFVPVRAPKPITIPHETSTTLIPCFINGYEVKTGPGERKIIKCK